MIPPTIHFIWIQDKNPFGFLELTSIKSVLKNTPYSIILHTNLRQDQTSEYNPYTLLCDRFTIDVQPYSCEVEGMLMKPSVITDFLRVKILQQYGGIYSDLDMIWFNPLPVDLTSLRLLGCWQNQSYKNVGTYMIACEKGYDFSEVNKKFLEHIETYKQNKKTQIKGKSLKEHLIFYREIVSYVRDHADLILKQKYFEKNRWKQIWRFLTNQIPEEKIVFKDICGIHICGSGLFGKYKCDTRELLTKHKGLAKLIAEF